MRLRGKKVLVTGGAGFLGSHLCEKLLAEGAEVRALDIFTSGRQGNLCAVLDKIDLLSCSVACEDSVGRAARDVDAVVHLAFPMTLRHRSVETKVITEILAGHLNLIRSVLDNNSLLIYISSIAVYGDGRYVPIDENHPLEPVLIHGAVKLAGETFCSTLAASNGLKVVVLRVADIYGPRNSRVSVPIKFLLQAMKNEPITVFGDGSDSRTYTYVSDFTEAVILSLIRQEAIGGIFNIGGDECVTMHRLAVEINKVTASNSPILFQDCPAAGRRLLISSCKAKEVLGFKPSFDMARGLALTYRWLRDNPDYYESI